MSSSVTLVIFEGGRIDSSLEEEFRQVRKGIVIDNIIKATTAGFERIILCTPYQDLAAEAKNFGVEVEFEEFVAEEFHFGNSLLKIIREYQLSSVLYMGGAAAPLISSAELAYVHKLMSDHDNFVTANNYFSADLIGFSPASALADITLPAIDNSLAMALVCEGDLKYIPLQRSLGLQFDLDTPSELLTLAIHPGIGEYTKRALAKIDLDTSKCLKIREIINDPDSELVVFGRIGSANFKLLDELTRCRIRLYSEERGLKALGRDVRGEAVSLLGKLILSLGYEDFFSFLAEICQGAVLDTRVLFAYFGWELSQSERFHSDLGRIEQINHPELREFTRCAHNAKIPILLGGHSLVTGGLWALIESSLLERV